MTVSPKKGYTRLVDDQAGAAITANGDFNLDDSLLACRVINRTTATPPGSPSEGDTYVVFTSPTGAWTGHAGHIAMYYNGWIFYVPEKSFQIYNIATGFNEYYDGANWISQVKTSTYSYAGATAVNFTLFYTTRAITITQLTAVLQGTTPSVAYTVRFANSRLSAGTEVVTGGTTVTNTSTGAILTSFTQANIPANRFVWLVTSAISGTVTEFSLTVEYKESY